MTAGLTTSPLRCGLLLFLLLLLLLLLLRLRANRRKPGYSRAVDDLAIRIESRSMARTIPCLLGAVPVNDTVQVGAYGRALVEVAALIAICGDLAATAAHHRSFARPNGGKISDIAGREVILVLFGDVHVFLHVFRSHAKLDAGGIVELCPLVLSSLYQLVEDDAGDGSVSHSVSGVACGDVDVLVTTRILADVRHVVDRLHHLSRPSVLHA